MLNSETNLVYLILKKLNIIFLCLYILSIYDHICIVRKIFVTYFNHWKIGLHSKMTYYYTKHWSKETIIPSQLLDRSALEVVMTQLTSFWFSNMFWDIFFWFFKRNSAIWKFAKKEFWINGASNNWILLV